jgi:hypothetical protein
LVPAESIPRGREKIAGVEIAVAEEFENVTVKSNLNLPLPFPDALQELL